MLGTATKVSIPDRKTQPIQHKARTCNRTLGILMILHTDAIQLKALYR